MKMRIILEVDNVDYAAIIRMLLPYVKEQDIPSLLKPVLDNAATPGVLENFLRLIPKDTQDNIVLGLVKKNKDRIIRKGQKLVDDFGIKGDVVDLRLKKVIEQ